MTPCRSGRMAEIVAGVRPIMRLASAPTAWISPEFESSAITDGSDSTIPRPRTYTSVLAVPRSTATSRPAAGMNDVSERIGPPATLADCGRDFPLVLGVVQSREELEQLS